MSLIYFDNQATTPLDPRVWQVMAPLYQGEFGNPGAIDTQRGRAAAERVEEARSKCASAVGADPREIVFTSGATEANNLALTGAMRLQIKKGRPRLLTFVTEHKCVLETAKALSREGAEVEILPVQSDGLIDLAALGGTLDDRVGLVSAMAVHNEIGVIQNLAALGNLANSSGALFHCDMAQALGKIPIDLDRLPIALASFSAHKAYGPMGVGALYVRRRPKAQLAPLLHGGGQERGLRSGTLSLPLTAGFGEAAARAAQDMEADLTRLWGYRGQVLGLVDRLPNLSLNGHRDQRVPGNFNLLFCNLSREQIREGLAAFEVSRGSACSAEDLEPSYVLTALGLRHEDAEQSVRISLGRFTTQEDVQALCQTLEGLGT